MESQRHHRIQVAVGIVVLMLTALPAAADNGQLPPFDEPPTITVDTAPDAVTVDATDAGHGDGVSGTGTQASGGPRCYLREITDMDEDLTLEYWRRRMMYAPYNVICGNENRGVVWILIDLTEPNPRGDTITPRDIAMRLRDRMPIPQVTIDINPTRGLVGAESWFWIDGYRGTPLTNSTDAFGQVVEVEARVTRYEWDFGDGTTITSETPGRAYPARSEVRHVYERSSAGLENGYEVVASFVFAVRYRIGGGGWIELPGITRLSQADYPVRESQSVIQR
jgi:hypothetical protein